MAADGSEAVLAAGGSEAVLAAGGSEAVLAAGGSEAVLLLAWLIGLTALVAFGLTALVERIGLTAHNGHSLPAHSRPFSKLSDFRVVLPTLVNKLGVPTCAWRE